MSNPILSPAAPPRVRSDSADPFARPVPVGSRVSPFWVKHSDANRLLLRTSSLPILLCAAGCLAVGLFFFSWLFMPGTWKFQQHGKSDLEIALGGVFVCGLILCVLVSFVGAALEFDAPRRSARKTWLFVFHTELPASTLRSVRVEIKNRERPAQGGAPPAIAAPQPLGKDECVVTLTGPDGKEAASVGRADLDAREWPAAGAAALEASRMLGLPVEIAGEPRFADEAGKAPWARFRAAATSDGQGG